MLHKLSASVPLYRCSRWHLHVPDHNTRLPSSTPQPPTPPPPTSHRHQTPGSLEPTSTRPAEFKCTQVYRRLCTPGLHDEEQPRKAGPGCPVSGVVQCPMSKVDHCPGLSNVHRCPASSGATRPAPLFLVRFRVLAHVCWSCVSRVDPILSFSVHHSVTIRSVHESPASGWASTGCPKR